MFLQIGSFISLIFSMDAEKEENTVLHPLPTYKLKLECRMILPGNTHFDTKHSLKNSHVVVFK